MKKILAFILCFIFMLSVTSYAEVVGHIYKTDIKAYEDYLRIPSYNCGGTTVIFARDIENYGYDVYWNERNMTVNISRNYSKKVTPIVPQFEGNEPVGTVLFDIYRSDIKTYFGGREIPSYNIGGKIAIALRSLESVGAVTFDAAALKALHTGSGIYLTGAEISHIDYIYKILDTMALVDRDIASVRTSPYGTGLSALNNSSSTLTSVISNFASYTEPSRFQKSSMELWWSMVNLELAANLLKRSYSSSAGIDLSMLERYIADSAAQRKNALTILATEF